MLKQSVTQSALVCYYTKFADVNVTGGGAWYPGEQVTVEGKLIFNWLGIWSYVQDATVQMTFAGQTYITTTPATSHYYPEFNFQFNITVPQNANGQYEVDLKYGGNCPFWALTGFSPCSYSFTVTIQPQGSQTSTTPQPPSQEQYPSQIAVTVSPYPTLGQSVTITAVATYPDGTPASGFKIDFAINGSNIGSATTNGNGVATISFMPQSTGSFTVDAYLDADSSVSGSASFTVSPQTPSGGAGGTSGGAGGTSGGAGGTSGTSCTSNSQCPQGYVCQNGTCVTAQGTSCTSTSQCPQGTVCQNGVCTQCNGVIIGSTCVPTWALIAGVGMIAFTGLVIAASK